MIQKVHEDNQKNKAELDRLTTVNESMETMSAKGQPSGLFGSAGHSLFVQSDNISRIPPPAGDAFDSSLRELPSSSPREPSTTANHQFSDNDEIEDYCLLIKALLNEIDAVKYDMDRSVRRNLHGAIGEAHHRNANYLAGKHGEGVVDNTIRNLIRPVRLERLLPYVFLLGQSTKSMTVTLDSAPFY